MAMNPNEQDPTSAAILELWKAYEPFAKCLLDGYVVIDTHGRVLKCNQLMATLVGSTSKQLLRCNSLDDVLTMTFGGNPLSSQMLSSAAGTARYDEVSGKTASRSGLNLIIGTYPLKQQEATIGAFVLIRDVTAETNLQGKYTDKAHQSITDPLTGLHNRAGYTEDLSARIERLSSLPPESPERMLCILMFDVDHFKKVNDTYGHQGGDLVLRETGKIMKGSFRRTDVVARYGGEEFIVILPSTDIPGAIISAEKVRKAIASHQFNFEDRTIPVTISCGVARVIVGQESADSAIARADEALYHSKRSGRNKVSLHDGQNILEAVAEDLSLPRAS